MNYVIIGNGTASVGMIEGIRSIDKDGPITVISEENHHVYGRPLISYYLEGKTDLERMSYRDKDFYKTNKCEVMYGIRASSIDSEAKEVTLEDGRKLCYDKLGVATGSRPFLPPMEGIEKVKNRFSFMTLDDALSLEKSLDKEARVLIVGAGLIGLKCAEGIKERVKSITVCDLSDRILSSILDNDFAGIVMKHLESKGITFLLSDTVSDFEEGKAFMKSGKEVEFDLLITAVGVRANTSLIKDAGGSVNRGIIVNSEMETDLKDVYAAGDCTEGFDSSTGTNRVLAILPNACMQGRTAGINMAGGSSELTNAIPMNSIGFFGLHIMTAGCWDGEMREEIEGDAVKRFFIKDGYLKGFILIGATERAGILTSLIRDKIPLETIDFELTEKVVSNMIFNEELRRKKFGGIV